jgi:prepilin-type N-terminal cleavage/methylation domain-containing protein
MIGDGGECAQCGVALSIRPGFTLLEILLVLAIMAIMATVVTLPRHGVGKGAGIDGDLERDVGMAQAAAIRSGRPVSAVVVINGDSAMILALPDGSVVTESSVPLAATTGRVLRHE